MSRFFEGTVTTLAFCWRLDRRDGVTLGFTSHDRDLMIGGISYRAAPGMLPSAIHRSAGFDADSMDVRGALADDAISEADLSAGRWDGAALRLFAVDWAAPDEMVPLARGELGTVELSDDAFSAELRGPTATLERAVVELTAPECRAEFGGPRCRIDLAGRRRFARLVAAEAERLVLDTAEPSANAYGGGVLRWVRGRNSGLTGAIMASAGAEIWLRDPPAFAPVAGDRVEIAEGCDKRFATCTGRFGNGVNFRGEPHLPGNDLLTRYPGG